MGKTGSNTVDFEVTEEGGFCIVYSPKDETVIQTAVVRKPGLDNFEDLAPEPPSRN